MIKTIKISKLFDKFNYTIDFSNEGILIITGPNGYGKSTILKMINELCNGNFIKLIDYSFSKFILICENSKIEIKKNKYNFSINNISLKYSDIDFIKETPYLFRAYYDEFIDLNENISRSYRASNRIYKETFEKKIFEKEVFDKLFENRFVYRNIESKEVLEKTKYIIDEIDIIKKEIGKVSFIQEQRLIEKRTTIDEHRMNHDKMEYITVINDNSDKLKKELSEIMENHSSLSSDLDSTYIERLFKTEDSDINTDYIKEQIQYLSKKQSKLKKYALAGIKDVSYLSDFDKDKWKRFSIELSIYLNDTKEKFNLFESIINKLELYEEIVNKKLSFKKMQLSRTNGIEVISDNGKQLSLNDLSSGEQEIIVLFYKLIFESDVNLLMIDEPEISLHIAWQKELMNDLKKVVELKKNMQLIIATHSPQIISHNWDLQVDLGGIFNA